MTTKIKIGIVGSRGYTNKKKIKDLIFEIKEKYGDEVEIVSGGQRDGADGFAKKFTLCFFLRFCDPRQRKKNRNIAVIKFRVRSCNLKNI